MEEMKCEMMTKALVGKEIQLFGYDDICNELVLWGFNDPRIDSYVDAIETCNVSFLDEHGDWYTIWFEPASNEDEQKMFEFTNTWYEDDYHDWDVLKTIQIRITNIEEN